MPVWGLFRIEVDADIEDSKRAAVIEQSSPTFYEFVLSRYTEMREDVRAGRLGGATVYATTG